MGWRGRHGGLCRADERTIKVTKTSRPIKTSRPTNFYSMLRLMSKGTNKNNGTALRGTRVMPLLPQTTDPLPGCPFPRDGILHEAYSRALSLEQSNDDDKRGLILGLMLLESSFSPSHQLKIAHDIMACENYNDFWSLAKCYKETFLIPCESSLL